MKKIAISEFKAKLSHYLRLVKAGEEIDVLERGIPIAKVIAQRSREEDLIIKPQAPINGFGKMRYTASLEPDAPDPVEWLLQDRAKR